jgi:hypothetical protein
VAKGFEVHMWAIIKYCYAPIKSFFTAALRGQDGNILRGILLVVLTIVILGALIPVVWPLMQDSTAAVGNITGSDPATIFLKTLYPVAILVVGFGIVAALIFFALKSFGIVGGKGRGGI